MFLFQNEPEASRRRRLADLTARVLHRLGDSDQHIWSYEEIESYILRAGEELASQCRLIWDQKMLECVPPGFNVNVDWERDYTVFEYGVAAYTMEDEADFIEVLGIEVDDTNHANHTSPSELHYLEGVSASTNQNALTTLPDTLTDVERATYDRSTIFASNHRRMERYDNRYQMTAGEPIGYIIEHDGYNRFRTIRVPNAMGDLYEYDGSWGIAREVEDTTRDTVSGTWGLPRQIAGHHPTGNTEGFGLPRRIYDEDDNLKIDFYRQPHVTATESELPNRYHWYLAEYAQWQALKRHGPGQNFKLAQLYSDRWKRGLARIQSRVNRQTKEKQHRMGGMNPDTRYGPPRPKLPWQYGQRLR